MYHTRTSGTRDHFLFYFFSLKREFFFFEKGSVMHSATHLHYCTISCCIYISHCTICLRQSRSFISQRFYSSITRERAFLKTLLVERRIFAHFELDSQFNSIQSTTVKYQSFTLLVSSLVRIRYTFPQNPNFAFLLVLIQYDEF